MLRRAEVSLETLSSLRRNVLPHLRLPAFQREFVWSEEQILACVDSLEKGYPVGQVLLWYPEGDGPGYVVDGQQRLTALLGTRPGDPLPRHELQLCMRTQSWQLRPTESTIGLWEVMDADRMGVLHDRMTRFGLEGFSGPKARSLIQRVDALQWTAIPVYKFKDLSAADTVEAFRRVNMAGTPISPEDMVLLLEQAASEAS